MQPPDQIDVARRTAGRILTDPLTWAPFVPLAALYAFFGLSAWVCLPLMLVVVIVLTRFWVGRWPVMNQKVHTEMLAVYRRAENVGLYERLRDLSKALAHLPTQRLIYDLKEAMEIKHAVENRLFEDGVITPHEEEVGEMMAGLVRTMVTEAERAPLCEGDVLPKAATARFQKAATTLRQAFEELDVMLDPVPENMRAPAENDALSRASERLGERLEQARGVRRKLEEGLDKVAADVPVPEVEAERSERRVLE